MKVPWRRGERIRAEIVERASDGDLICAIEGRLFRVKNRTGRLYRDREVLELVVIATDPLELQLPGAKTLHRVL